MTFWQYKSEGWDFWKKLSKISRACGYAYPPSPYWCTKKRGERQVHDKNYSITEFNGFNTQTLKFDRQKHWSLNWKIFYPNTLIVLHRKKAKGKHMSRVIKVSYEKHWNT